MMRVGGLYPGIGTWDNLRLAYWKARKGANECRPVRRFEERLDDELARLAAELEVRAVRPGGFTRFLIRDPKERLISAPVFRDRVLHHAIMNVCEPWFDRRLIADSFACRKGKGRLAALARATEFSRRHGWFLKLDVRKYFDSIPHARLLEELERIFKDRELLELFARIIGSHESAPGRGLPIGSLMSQHFANFYLNPVDRLVKERLRIPGYVRYMDDMVLWADGQVDLERALIEVRESLELRLGLELKRPAGILNRAAHGVAFCGFRIFPGWRELGRAGRIRFRARLRELERRHAAGLLGESELQTRVTCLIAFAKEGDTWQFRRRVLTATASTASTAAAHGTTTPPTAAPPTATGTSQATATTTWASAPPQLRPPP
jgi:RNA-directed DNA polymerase